MDDGDDHAERDEENTDPEEKRRMLHVHPTCGREDLTTRSASRKAKRHHRPPRRTGHYEDHQRDQCTEQEKGDRGSRSNWMSAVEPATALQKKSVAPVPNTPPVGTA